MNNLTIILIKLLIFYPSFVLADKITINVVDKQTKIGIKSEIYHYDEYGKKKRQGITDNKGNIIINKGKPGQSIKIKPVSKRYFDIVVECPIKARTIKLTKINYYLEKEIKSMVVENNYKTPSVKYKFNDTRLLDEISDNNAPNNKFNRNNKTHILTIIK